MSADVEKLKAENAAMKAELENVRVVVGRCLPYIDVLIKHQDLRRMVLERVSYE